ncbi:hypothetical protein SDRG_03256 [Saprolegnia diclina VS20]|uniref:Uncharacterized protein n=1 Tax=Saprolegnia diclina (strain VS20) TaxID=1156394 RepID=T0S2A6_SAPDV|nr:hypothetical protein SDRG_03256 [Saprolegnia diclina VS20]EQC39048.1 hypothetical protein SDRG_03256 [Saprolegnia diclina VS20]|eukprot:XP_008607109.1 hypothetical protein SDRG_03256 [Saprolegnia diclina VS20]
MDLRVCFENFDNVTPGAPRVFLYEVLSNALASAIARMHGEGVWVTPATHNFLVFFKMLLTWQALNNHVATATDDEMPAASRCRWLNLVKAGLYETVPDMEMVPGSDFCNAILRRPPHPVDDVKPAPLAFYDRLAIFLFPSTLPGSTSTFDIDELARHKELDLRFLVLLTNRRVETMGRLPEWALTFDADLVYDLVKLITGRQLIISDDMVTRAADSFQHFVFPVFFPPRLPGAYRPFTAPAALPVLDAAAVMELLRAAFEARDQEIASHEQERGQYLSTIERLMSQLADYEEEETKE